MPRIAIAGVCTMLLLACSGPGDTEPIGASESAMAMGVQPERALHPGDVAEAPTVMRFGTMYGVDGPFIDDTSIRGVKGDELPWSIGRVWGSLSAGGRLKLEVRG